MMWTLLFLPAVAFAGFANTMQALPAYTFSWTADTTANQLNVEATVNAGNLTFGWLGFGIAGGGGGMIGADMFTAYPNGTGCNISDRMAVAHSLPPQDVDQGGFADWYIDSCSYSNNVFIVAAHRAFQTFDTFDLDFVTGPMELVFVWSTQVPTSESTLQFHDGGYTPLQVSLWGEINPVFNASQLPPNTDNLTYLMPNASVGPGTNYICTGFTLTTRNNMSTQAIVFEPVIDPVNIPYVHHMVIYTCNHSVGATPFTCFSMPSGCNGILYAWGKGGGPLVIPAETGVDIGTPGRTYVTLQIHYNNVYNVPNIVDDSGLTIYRTNTLRPTSAGFFLLGTVDVHLPPGYTSYSVSGSCGQLQTRAALPSQGVTIFASFLHAHQRGRRIWTDVKRSGEIVFQIGDNQNYDFNLQKVQILSPYQQVLPGDDFITYCTYDTANETTTINYGETTQNEMCFNFAMYYPIIGGCPTANCFGYDLTCAASPGPTSCALIPGEPSAAYVLSGLVQQDENFWTGGSVSCAKGFKGTAVMTCAGHGAPFVFSGCTRPTGPPTPESSAFALSISATVPVLVGLSMYI